MQSKAEPSKTNSNRKTKAKNEHSDNKHIKEASEANYHQSKSKSTAK